MERDSKSSGEGYGVAGLQFRHQGEAVGLREKLTSGLVLVPLPQVAIPPRNELQQEDAPSRSGRSTRWIVALLTVAVLGGGVWWTAWEFLPPPFAATDVAAVAAAPAISVPASEQFIPAVGADSLPPPVVSAAAPVAPSTAAELVVQQPRRRDLRARPTAPVNIAKRPSVTLESVVATQGLPEVEVRAAIIPLQEQLRRCHSQAIERGQGADQRIVADITVRGSTVASIAPRSSIRSPRLWSCVRAALLSAKFGRAPAYAEASITLRLGSP